MKHKKLPPKVLEKMLDHLGTKRALSRNGEPSRAVLAGMLLVSGCLTGLRPSEWAGTRIIDGADTATLVLLVPNGKQGNNRSHGPSRHVELGHLEPSLWRALVTMVAAMNELAGRGELDRAINSARRIIRDVNEVLWPRAEKHYTLYSARHQFSASTKASLPEAAVAALMGHASADTAGYHYGRRRAGRSSIMPGVNRPEVRAADEETARVRPRRKMGHENRQQARAAPKV